MKTYVLNVDLLLTDKVAEMNELDNRWYRAGELIDLPDPLAKRLIEKGSIELYVPPKPTPAAKKAAPKKIEEAK